MKLRMPIEVELDEKVKAVLDKSNYPDKVIEMVMTEPNFIGLGTITSISDIDYLEHKIVEK